MKPSIAKSKTTSEALAQAMAAFGAHAKIHPRKRKTHATQRIKVSRWVKPRFDITVKPAPRDKV